MNHIYQDQISRIADSARSLTDGLTDEVARYRPDDQANTIAWLLWHSGRCIDAQLAQMTESEELWPAWADKFTLPPEDQLGFAMIGYQMDPNLADQVNASPEVLRDYILACCNALTAYAVKLDISEADRIVDRTWEPAVTAGVRFVSIIDDVVRHLGAAEYLRGLAERALAR